MKSFSRVKQKFIKQDLDLQKLSGGETNEWMKNFSKGKGDDIAVLRVRDMQEERT